LPGELAAVARSPHAAHLRCLETADGASTAAALALAASPHLKGLVKLVLGRGQVGPEGAEALAGGSLPDLEELVLRDNPIGDRGALARARFVRSKGDGWLDLTRTGVTAAGLAALAGSGCLAGLFTLKLDGNPVGDAAAAALASCADLGGLDWLSLTGTGLTDEGAIALAASPHLPRQLALHVDRNAAIGEPAKAALRGRFARPYCDPDPDAENY
jgi:hypothetical protein